MVSTLACLLPMLRHQSIARIYGVDPREVLAVSRLRMMLGPSALTGYIGVNSLALAREQRQCVLGCAWPSCWPC